MNNFFLPSERTAFNSVQKGKSEGGLAVLFTVQITDLKKLLCNMRLVSITI